MINRSIYLTTVISLLIIGYLVYYKVSNININNPLIKPMTYPLNLTAKTIVVVGSGLAGIVASLTVAEQGHEVILLEKEMKIGGNSIKASSGINGAGTICQRDNKVDDNVDILERDTLISAGDQQNALIHTLAKNSPKAIQWLMSSGIQLKNLVKMGGHTQARTHIVTGHDIISTLEKKIITHKNIHLVTGARFTSYIIGLNGKIAGVIYNYNQKLFCNGVIMATGGFAANIKMVEKYRPDLKEIKWTTNSSGSMGEGLSQSTQIKASLIDMDKIQIHPTGFVDPLNPKSRTKFLAPELLRGEGGLLFKTNGYRFCDELGRRDEIVSIMKETLSSLFFIVISQQMKDKINSCNFYVQKGLLKKLNNVDEVAQYMKIDNKIIREEFKKYNRASLYNSDKFGKTTFPNSPLDIHSPLYIGVVSPVLHYCMGGLQIDGKARVIDTAGKPIPYMFAAGEVTGGIHRNNRLGGNSLLDCVVFGRVAGLSAVKYSSNTSVIVDVLKH